MKICFQKSFVLLPAFLMPGITAAQSAVSSEAAQGFVTRFETTSESDWADWKKISDFTRGVVFEGLAETWVQPVNKKESCRLHAVAAKENPWWENKENRIVWDGGCKGGFAYGIGREFATVRGELSSWLADYKEPGTPPTYYLVTHYDRKVIQFKAASGPYHVEVIHQVNEASSGTTFITTQTVGDFFQNRFYRQVHVAGSDQVVKSMVLPNKNSYFSALKYDTINSENVWWTADYNGQTTGYGVKIKKLENVLEVRHHQLDAGKAPQEVRLPETYLRHLTDIDRKINQKLSIADGLMRETFVAINIYKRRVCQGQVAVNFVNPEIYGRICLDSGELSAYTNLLTSLNEQKEKRHAHMREEYSRKKGEAAAPQLAEAAAHQHLEQTQRQQAEARREKPDYSEFGRAVAEFANSMSDLHRQSTQFTQSYMNSHLRPPVNFGMQGGGQINCILVSNIFDCRAR